MAGFTASDLQAQIPRLRRYARALTGNRDSADDLTQDTLERAWTKRALWRPDPQRGAASLPSWLLAVMHRVFLNHLRRARLTEPLPDELASDLPAAGSVDTADAASTLRDLQQALAALSPEHRAVLLLVALEGLSYQDTAAVLEVPVGTVMSRLARARERLRQTLEGPVSAPLHLRRVK